MTSILRKLALPCVLSVLPVSQAALVNYVLTGTFSQSDVPSSIAVGDTYSLSFTFNTNSEYTSLTAGNFVRTALFADAITNLVFDHSGSGTFADKDPIANASLRLVQTEGFTTYQIYTTSPSQFGSFGGQTVSNFDLSLRTEDIFSFFFPSYSLAGEFVPYGFEVDDYLPSPRRLTINTSTFFAFADVSGGAVGTMIPEPATAGALCGLVALGLACAKRRKRSI